MSVYFISVINFKKLVITLAQKLCRISQLRWWLNACGIEFFSQFVLSQSRVQTTGGLVTVPIKAHYALLKSFMRKSRTASSAWLCTRHFTNLESLASDLRASAGWFAWSPSRFFPRIVHWPCPTIRPPGDENNRRSSSIKWNTKEKAWNENFCWFGGSFGYGCRCVVFILCVILWWAHHSAAAWSFVHAHVQCLAGSIDTNQNRTDPSDGRKRLGHSFINWLFLSLYNYWYHKNSTLFISRHIIIIIIITTLFHYFRFKNHKRLVLLYFKS